MFSSLLLFIEFWMKEAKLRFRKIQRPFTAENVLNPVLRCSLTSAEICSITAQWRTTCSSIGVQISSPILFPYFCMAWKASWMLRLLACWKWNVEIFILKVIVVVSRFSCSLSYVITWQTHHELSFSWLLGDSGPLIVRC